MMCNIVPQTTMVEELQKGLIHIEVAARILVAVPLGEAPRRPRCSLSPNLQLTQMNGSLLRCVDPYLHWWCLLSATLGSYGQCWTRRWIILSEA